MSKGIRSDKFLQIGDLYYQKGLENTTFEMLYPKLRTNENRKYSIDTIKSLPLVPKEDLYKREWDIRSGSAQRFFFYLQQKKRALNILEVGCGNGWLSNRLSYLEDSSILGLDINLEELKDASIAFADRLNLNFVYGNISDPIFVDATFDIVVLAASIQYFEKIDALLQGLLRLLKSDGEIHIFDSPLYATEQIEGAANRSLQHFQSVGCPEMQNHFFHHTYREIEKFNPKIIYNPNAISNRVVRIVNPKASPFPWIRIPK